CLPGQGPQGDEVVEVGRPDDELADVDDPVLAGDVRDDDVQPRAVGQHRVDERRGQVDPAAAGLEHALDQVAHLVGRQDGGRQLRDTAPGHEHLGRLVDPDLLDLRVV